MMRRKKGADEYAGTGVVRHRRMPQENRGKRMWILTEYGILVNLGRVVSIRKRKAPFSDKTQVIACTEDSDDSQYVLRTYDREWEADGAISTIYNRLAKTGEAIRMPEWEMMSDPHSGVKDGSHG